MDVVFNSSSPPMQESLTQVFITDIEATYNGMSEMDVHTRANFSYSGTDIESSDSVYGSMLNLIIAPILVVFGTVGNILTLYVLSKSKFTDMTVSVYLRTLAVVDTLFLWISDDMARIIEHVTTTNIFSAEWACKSWTWIRLSLPRISSWLLVAVSIERTICIKYPYKAKIWCTKKNAICVTTFLCLFFLAAFIPFAMMYNAYDTPGACLLSEDVYFAFSLIATLTYSVIPGILITICNFIIIQILLRAARKRSQMLRASCKNLNLNITVMLLINSFVFIILTGPINISLFIEHLCTTEILSDSVYTMLSLMATSNHAVNFLLYLCSCSQFRHELVTIFCTCKNNGSNSTQPSQTNQKLHSNRY